MNDNITINIITNWGDLNNISRIWNDLVSSSEVVNNEMYHYDFVKTISIARTKPQENGHPFCFIIKEDNKIINILPFYLRVRKQLIFKKTKYLSFFPTILTIRHNYILGQKLLDVDYNGILKQVFQIINQSRIDIIQLNGLRDNVSDELISYCKNFGFKYRKYRINNTEGTKQSDFLGFELPLDWDTFLHGLKKRFINDYHRNLRNINKVGFVSFSRYSNGKYFGLKEKVIKELFNDICEIGNDCWQKNENQFSFTTIDYNLSESIINILFEKKQKILL